MKRRTCARSIFAVLLKTAVLASVLLLNGTVSPAYARVAQSAAQESRAKTTEPAAYYIVFEKGIDGKVLPVYYRTVQLAVPPETLTAEQVSEALSRPTRNAEQVVVSLRAADGRDVFQSVVDVSPWLRAEFKGETDGAPIDGHFVRQETSSFVVRVPQVAGTTLVLRDGQYQGLGQFDMQQLAANTPVIGSEASAQPGAASGSGGPAGNRVELLVMGDGYTSAQESKFNSDAASTLANFFAISPLSVYQNYFNTHILFTASSQSGADHPPYSSECGLTDPTCCADPAMLYDPLRGKMVATAFDSRFCAYGIHRGLMADDTKVLAAAAAVPDWDAILLLVNDSTYGGTGGTVATISMHASAVQMAQHEFGHSFVDLGDEYESEYPGYPACSDLGGYAPCESNVTDVTTRAAIKWNPWIKSTTPIPTAETSAWSSVVGLFHGARYQSTGMYRPGYNCIMRTLGMPFCQVPTQSFVLKLYQGGWGEHADGISLIEPTGISPANPVVNITHPGIQDFHVATLGPVGGPPVQITWLKNGVPIPAATTSTYRYVTSPGDPANVDITVVVKDATRLVKSVMAGGALQDEYTWNLTVNYASRVISGSAGVPGTTLQYDDGGPRIAISDSAGQYAFGVPGGWSGTVTPSKTGCSFTPPNKSYTLVGANLPGENYSPACTAVLIPRGANDGWVLESSETSGVGGTFNATATTLQLGDDASRRQYRAILSFATGSLPDSAIITSAILSLKRQAVMPAGSEPFSGFQGLMIDMHRGFFGSGAALEAMDFQAPADMKGLGPFGPTPVAGVYELPLPAEAFPFINQLSTDGGVTQLRLRFKLDDNNNATADYIRFFSGNYAIAASRPALTITYYVP